MSFIDQLYEYYREEFTGEAGEAELVAISILEESTRDDVIGLIERMSDEELFGLMTFYLAEGLKARMVREGMRQEHIKSSYSPGQPH